MKLSPGRLRAVAVILVAIVVGVVVWLVFRGNGSTSPLTPTKTIGAFSQSALTRLAGAVHKPIYWEGARPGTTYEVTQITDGRIFVRYLPRGAKAGSPHAYPFVATFPFPNAYPGTNAVAHHPGAVRIPLAPNAVAFYSRKLPTNAWIAFRGSNYQIEVFDPHPRHLRAVIAKDMIQPVLATAPGTVTASSVRAASPASLDALPARVGHPVYWIGARRDTKYELTLTPTGSVFVRYLPAAGKIGANVRYPFVGSLPVANAYAATARAAARPGSVKVPVPGGAVAFYGRSLPTNIYVAFPGSNYQVELFNPNPRRALAEVRSGLVHPLP